MSDNNWRVNRIIAQTKIDYFCIILGSLNEYFGGYSRNGSCVESFFVNELVTAKRLVKVCEKYIQSQNAVSDIEFKVTKEGFSSIFSTYISSQLAETSNPKKPFLAHKTFSFHKNVAEWTDDEKWSYLIGAYLRQFNDNSFRFANAISKVYRVHTILSSFCDEDDHLILKSYFRTPSVSYIYLNDDNIILRVMEQYIKEFEI